MNNKLTGGIHPAVAAVWAAVIASVHILPTFPILGTGGTFSISSVLIPLSGIFFGPIAGALCSAVGCFLGSLIAPFTAWVGLGTFIIGTTTAFTTGCIAWGKWPPFAIGGILVYIIGTVLWFTQEIGRNIFIYPLVYYGLGFISLIAEIILAPRFFLRFKAFSEISGNLAVRLWRSYRRRYCGEFFLSCIVQAAEGILGNDDNHLSC